jgi:undecaprenyl-diphosphatase
MDYVSHIVTTHGYVLIFILVFLDQAAVSIPSPPFVTAMGVLASRGRFNIWFAFLVVLAAAMVADCLWFRIGLSTLRLHRPIHSKRWNEHIPKIANLVRRGVVGAILSVKFSLLPSALVPFAAGSTRLPAQQFLYMVAVGNLAWTVAFLIGGFTAGYAVLTFFGHRGVLNVTLACCLCLILPAALHSGRQILARLRRCRTLSVTGV